MNQTVVFSLVDILNKTENKIDKLSQRVRIIDDKIANLEGEFNSKLASL
ncbi:MAG: hypothetical protein RML10_11870 [Geminocystis sp.]|nr:hypothetical protein [Geminocystis sp.]MCX8079402.1 hypothetical protein [Geminocystis sp.]MDW8464248.1 hypothetical protein [Geminocystis sp.]HIK37103.1 hypothetical protein [Geminocystis sp. M7585_C2015_104]